MKQNSFISIFWGIVFCAIVANNYSFGQDKKPEWVNGKLPNTFNELYASGRANIGPNKILAEKKADDDARHELGKTINVKLNSVLTRTLSENIDLVNTENTTSNEIAAEVTKTSTEVILTGTTVVERWEDKENSIMYSLLVMKKEQVVKQVNNVIKDDPQKYFVEDKKSIVIQKIDDELEKWDLAQ